MNFEGVQILRVYTVNAFFLFLGGKGTIGSTIQVISRNMFCIRFFSVC